MQRSVGTEGASQPAQLTRGLPFKLHFYRGATGRTQPRVAGWILDAQGLQAGSLKVSTHDRSGSFTPSPPSRRVGFAPRADIRPMPALVSARPSFREIGSQPISENVAIGSSFDVASKAIFQFRSVEGRLLELLLRI